MDRVKQEQRPGQFMSQLSDPNDVTQSTEKCTLRARWEAQGPQGLEGRR